MIFYTLLFLGIVLIPAALILVTILLLDHKQNIWVGIAHFANTAGVKLARVEPVRKLVARFPRATGLARRRLELGHPFGLALTIAGIGIFAAIWLFAGLWYDIAAKDPIVTVDLRLHNLMPLLRTDALTTLMIALTEIASAPVMGLTAFGIALLALSANRPRMAVSFVLAATFAGALTLVLKGAIGHARPTDALIQSHTASFPSGHLLGASVVYGLLATVLLRSRAAVVSKILGTTCLLLLIVGVGVSRLYLGVHWPSDLLGSLAVALGLLSALVFFLHADVGIPAVDSIVFVNRGLLRLGGLATIALAAAIAFGFSPGVSRVPAERSPPDQRVPLSTLLQADAAVVPTVAEGMFGLAKQSICLLLIGSEADLVRAFRAASWVPTDRPTPSRVMQGFIARMAGRQDPSAPAPPLFVADAPQALSFTSDDRSHSEDDAQDYVRVWRRNLCTEPACQPIWLASASSATAMGVLVPSKQSEALVANDGCGRVARQLVEVGGRPDTGVGLATPRQTSPAFVRQGQAFVVELTSNNPGK